MPVLLLALLVVLLTAAPAQGAVSLHKVGDFNQPTFIAGAPGDFDRLYVVEQGGTIRVVRNGATLGAPFADISGVVSNVDERGLLSVAFRPNFQTSRLLYVYFTNNAGNIEVDELRATTAERTDPAYRRKVIEIPHQEAGNHNGGQLQFGRDGALYLGPGDGGNAYDLPTRDAIFPSSKLGKILRIAPTAGGGYQIPAGNPFGNEVWSYGLRNPWRFSFDRLTGDLTIGDVGQDYAEEVDYVAASAGAGKGRNFQWDECEGTFDANPGPTVGSPCPYGAGAGPVLQHLQSTGWCSVIGGYVVRDPSLPSLSGRYVYGDLCVAELWSAKLSVGGAGDDRTVGVNVSGLTSFGEDTAGCVYASSYNGGVYRLVETSTRIPCARPPGGGGGGGDIGGPQLKVRVPKRQRVRKRHGAIAYARCDEACTVKMTAKLLIGGRSYKLRSTSAPAAANVRIKLKAKLTKKASRRLRRALRRHRRAKVSVRLRARDAAGNRSRLVKRKLRVKR